MKIRKANFSFGSIWYYMAALLVIFIAAFIYIFNAKIDLNGDNCDYYMLATSIAKGHGYSNISSPDYSPSNVFPPGYPLIMSLVRLFTSNIIAQKIMNGIFLLFSSLLIFLFVRKNQLPDSLAFVISAAILLNANILHFTTMMMSEMSYLLFLTIALWSLFKLDDKKSLLKDKYFYLLIFSTAYAYHIRTQGITLIIAVITYLLISKKWKESLAYSAGTFLCMIPWMIRNHVTGVGSSRYLNQIFEINSKRPEEGSLEISGLFFRFFETLKMLVTKAIPNSVIPYINVNYETATSAREWGIAIILLVLIIIGFWQFKRLRYFFILYTLANLSIISLFNDPGQNRYITTLLPFLGIGLFTGLNIILSKLVQKLKIAGRFSPWIFMILIVFCSFPKLKKEHIQNKALFPPNFLNYFRLAHTIRKELPKDIMICSRKPGLFYMYSRTWVCNYQWTNDDIKLIQGLIDSKVDYVVLEQLGYSSTPRYLYPAITKHEDLFAPAMYIPNPDTYLLKFDREAAIKKLNKLSRQTGL